MIFDYFALAFNNLRRRGIRSWLTMLGVFIGIAAVVSLISLGAGLQTAITGQFGALSVDVLSIQNAGTGFGPPGSTVIEKLNERDLRVVEEASDEIKIIVPRLIRVVSFEFNEIRSFEYIADIPEDKEKREFVYKSANIKAAEGRLLEANDEGKVFLGSDFKGDRFEKEIVPGSTVLIQGEEFEVIGIAEETGTFTVNSAILMLNSDVKELLDIDDEIDLIVVQVRDKDDIELVAEEIENELRNDRNLDEGEEDFSVQTPIQSLEGVNTILNIINLVVAGIAAISLLVGAIGITNTMYTSVLERTKEIGIMKAVGARNKDVLILFLIESALLGMVGGIIGAIIGLGLAFGVSNLVGSFLGDIGLQVSISYPLILSSIAFSLIIGVVSGVLPALQASKLNVVDALRK